MKILVICGLYTKNRYGELLENINQRFGDIKPAVKGDKESEMRTFLEIYNRMGQIPYDEYATSEEGKKDQLLQITARNLEGALLEGKCVCSGYAETLRNLLALKGIEAKYVGGHNPKTGSAHAWNQVKIGGQWFNVDLTWDRDDIAEMARQGKRIGPEVLKTDEEFREHAEYRKNRSNGEEKCDVSINELFPNLTNQKMISSLEPLANAGYQDEANHVPQDLGLQVQNMLQANHITTAEFTNQMRQIEQMRQLQQVQQMQQVSPTQGMEIGG